MIKRTAPTTNEKRLDISYHQFHWYATRRIKTPGNSWRFASINHAFVWFPSSVANSSHSIVFANYWYGVWKFLNGKPASSPYSYTSWFSIEELPNSISIIFQLQTDRMAAICYQTGKPCECMIAGSESATACGRLDLKGCMSMKLVVNWTLKNSSSHLNIYTMLL